MKRYPGLVVMMILACGLLQAEESWRPLWNGKDFSGWSTYISKPHPSSEVPGMAKDEKGNYKEPIGANRDPLGVFTITAVDGRPAIRISGQAFGELRSAESLTNYHLKLQFKWGTKKWPPRDKPETQRDSGLLYHVHAAPGAEGRIWARSTELQIQERDVGDLYSIGSFVFVRSSLRKGTGNATTKAVYDYDPQGPWNVFAQVPGQDGRCVKQPDAEKPTGEWNTVELVCFGEDSIHIVNGKVVMRLRSTMRMDTKNPEVVTAGPIILQSEGAEIFYRDVEWKPIKAVPAEYADPATSIPWPRPAGWETQVPVK